ncbi:MAG: DUF1634 domain-containing protein [Rhodospirillales bacterium]|nr:DUF1634 domain-containing protein [Rhodospirillales bacterium]
MTTDLAHHPGLERLLAKLLHRGTWVASCVIALGLVLTLVNWPGVPLAMTGTRIVTAGIALFILLPVLRVLLMLIVFLRERDYRFGAIAMLVLAIICLGAVLGTHMAGGLPG